MASVPVLLQGQELLLLAAAAAAAAAGQEQLLQVTHQAVRAGNHLHGMCSTTTAKITKHDAGEVRQLYQAHFVEDPGCCSTMSKAALCPTASCKPQNHVQAFSNRL